MEEIILKIKNKKELKDVLWKPFLGELKYHKNIHVMILNAPCNGFGDVIFAIKLYNYLKEWYHITVTIATTHASSFVSMGMCEKNIINLTSPGRIQCRRFKKLKPHDMNGKRVELHADLYFMAPLPFGMIYSLYDIRYIVKNANKYNVMVFSEYNKEYPQDYDFPIGVGNKYMGIFLTSPVVGKRLSQLPNPYAMVYIAAPKFIPGAEKCISSFIEMVTTKYQYPKFDIIIPTWVSSIKLSVIHSNYSVIMYSQKRETFAMKEGTGNTLTFRQDIFPVSNKDMLSIIKYSVKDILVTGDQSISDVLSCCPQKNIFYQIAYWKESFASELAKRLPNIYLAKKKTSCGTLSALKYNSQYSEFINEWDFRKKGKEKLDAVLTGVYMRMKNPDIYNLLISSRSLRTLKNKILK